MSLRDTMDGLAFKTVDVHVTSVGQNDAVLVD